jgi:hypothetical protein
LSVCGTRCERTRRNFLLRARLLAASVVSTTTTTAAPALVAVEVLAMAG